MKSSYKFSSIDKLKQILTILGLDYYKGYPFGNQFVSKYSLSLYEVNIINNKKNHLNIDINWEVPTGSNELSYVCISKLDKLQNIEDSMIITKEFDKDILIKIAGRYIAGEQQKVDSYYIKDSDDLLKIIVDYYISLIGRPFFTIKRDINLRLLEYEFY